MFWLEIISCYLSENILIERSETRVRMHTCSHADVPLILLFCVIFSNQLIFKMASFSKKRLQQFVTSGQLLIKDLHQNEAQRPNNTLAKFGVIVLNCSIDELNRPNHGFTASPVSEEEEQIDEFVACLICKRIYSYIAKNGTSTLGRHVCESNDDKQRSMDEFLQGPDGKRGQAVVRKNATTLPTMAVQNVRDLETKFIVSRLRPFNLVEDEHFRNFIQSVSDVSAKYGSFDVVSVLHCTKTLTEDIRTKAAKVLEKISSDSSKVIGKHLS